jgi:hypothetical protein
MAATVDDVLGRRLRTQRLTAAPLSDPADVVRLLTCVQAQDPPFARYSVAMRAGCRDDEVRRAIDEGRVVRTHILRPTWHFVAPEDLRWILALTSPKVEAGLAARHRHLGLDDATLLDRCLATLVEHLSGRRLTRRALAAALTDEGLTLSNEQLGHVLLVAELRGLICSGPLDGQAHTYGLVDELVAPAPRRDRQEAIRELVVRFFTGHGPAAVTDLTRWTKLTQAEIKPALADAGDRLEKVNVDGLDLWFDPAADAPEDRPRRRALLLPVFDEAFLTYPTLNFPKAEPYPARSERGIFTESATGVILLDRRNVGWWKRTNKGSGSEVVLAVARSVSRRDREVIVTETDRLAALTGRPAAVTFLAPGTTR